MQFFTWKILHNIEWSSQIPDLNTIELAWKGVSLGSINPLWISLHYVPFVIKIKLTRVSTAKQGRRNARQVRSSKTRGCLIHPKIAPKSWSVLSIVSTSSNLLHLLQFPNLNFAVFLQMNWNDFVDECFLFLFQVSSPSDC